MEELARAVQWLEGEVRGLSGWVGMSFLLLHGIFAAMLVLVGYRMIFFILRYGDRKRN